MEERNPIQARRKRNHKDLHDPTGENPAQDLLLPRFQLQRPDHRNRKQDNHHVGNDAEHRIRHPRRRGIDAGARRHRSPELLDGRAHEHAGEDGGDRDGRDEGDERPVPELEAGRLEHALVLHQDGEFGEPDGGAVRYDAKVHPLKTGQDFLVARYSDIRYNEGELRGWREPTNAIISF